MKITELKTEYRDNPIGLDNPHPRFSWILESEDRDVRQQAYRIVVKTDEETPLGYRKGGKGFLCADSL